MQILDTNALNGPNYWSNDHHQLIVAKIKILRSEKLPQRLLQDFIIKLAAYMDSDPLLKYSSVNKQELLEKLGKQQFLDDFILHLALGLQQLASMNCHFGKVYIAKNDIYYIIFEYEVESAGMYAVKIAVKIAQCLANFKLYKSLKKHILKLKEKLSIYGLGPSTKSIVEEAIKRDIPFRRLNKGSLGVLGYGCNQKLINATATSDTSVIGSDLASEKDFTKEILAAAYIPVPMGIVIRDKKGLKDAMKDLNFPLVIKPLDGNHGLGVTTNILTKERALTAYKLAKQFSSLVIVEHFINGFDYRLLIINYKLVAAAKRHPAAIIGDGVSTVQQLIDRVNSDPKRGDAHENILTKIKIDQVTLEILTSYGLTLESILPKGQEMFLKYSANISTGGTAMDVTDTVHPDNICIVERAARLLNLNLCGIDMICEDITKPLTKDTGAIIEVNASPGIRMHLSPHEGKARNVAKEIVDMLYPKGHVSRIPIIAVTGTNGKTTVVRLIAQFAMLMGNEVGYTTTDGIYLNNTLIYTGDCSGPKSARMILREPTVEYAVLECARGGILDYGLGFDKCNISVVMNVSADHLGLKDIETIEELAKVKEVVPKSTFEDGYAILNADDDLVYAMKDQISCKISLFSMSDNNPRVDELCTKGGIAAYLKQDNIIIRQGDIRKTFANINDLPLTFSGTSTAMIQNILAAVLAGILSKFDIKKMEYYLKELLPTSENVPGRMNLFDFGDFRVLIDYAHNVGAFLELDKYLSNVHCKRKIGIMSSPGDRRDEDIINLGYHAANIFDEIIIKFDKNSRGRENSEILSLLKRGIAEFDHNYEIRVIEDEQEAIEFAIKNVNTGDFIAYFPDKVFPAIDYLNKISPMQSQSTKFYE